MRALLLAVALATFFGLSAGAEATNSSVRVVPGDELVNQIDQLRTTTWRWQRVMGEPLVRTSLSYRTDPSRRYKRWVRDLWRRRAVGAHRRALNPPHKGAWLCLYLRERRPSDGWATNTGNGYYGGLQMDLSFQLRYGRNLYRRKGTADHWTAFEQMWTAERAFPSVGYTAWPNTARACGLL